jgi:hypothetical protein
LRENVHFKKSVKYKSGRRLTMKSAALASHGVRQRRFFVRVCSALDRQTPAFKTLARRIV